MCLLWETGDSRKEWARGRYIFVSSGVWIFLKKKNFLKFKIHSEIHPDIRSYSNSFPQFAHNTPSRRHQMSQLQVIVC